METERGEEDGRGRRGGGKIARVGGREWRTEGGGKREVREGVQQKESKKRNRFVLERRQEKKGEGGKRPKRIEVRERKRKRRRTIWEKGKE